MFQRSTISRSIGLFLCWLMLTPFMAKAQSKEYQVKAAFLLNFTKFVEWQAAALPEGPEPFCIVILGDDPFGQTLDATLQGETVKGHKMVIHRVQRLSDVKECHLLFISKSEKGRVSAILTELKDRPVLTVSEVDDFAERGGHI
ncbi:MAG: YfiR family protein, partial [Verrucomicrobia bacterium]|nr:YfiR family protein [Verrucomicrobiota bacterium]